MLSLRFSRSFLARLPLALLICLPLTSLSGVEPSAMAETAQPAPAQPLTLRSDIQEANAKTGVVVARGNVQINYPARQIQATAAQALYFSRERRIVLSGDVYVLQQGNSLRGETITYLIDEGRFVATPQAPKQVESIYLVQDAPPQPQTQASPGAPPFSSTPEFRTPAGTAPSSR